MSIILDTTPVKRKKKVWGTITKIRPFFETTKFIFIILYDNNHVFILGFFWYCAIEVLIFVLTKQDKQNYENNTNSTNRQKSNIYCNGYLFNNNSGINYISINL